MLYNVALSDNKLYSISKTAEALGISSQTLRRWDKSGKFISKRHPINNYRVYTEDKINTFIAELESKSYLNFNDRNLDNVPVFFETEYGKLFNIDAFEFLKSIPDHSIELIFADPPYNIKKAEWDTFESQKKYIEWSLEWIKEASRILTD